MSSPNTELELDKKYLKDTLQFQQVLLPAYELQLRMIYYTIDKAEELKVSVPRTNRLEKEFLKETRRKGNNINFHRGNRTIKYQHLIAESKKSEAEVMDKIKFAKDMISLIRPVLERNNPDEIHKLAEQMLSNKEQAQRNANAMKKIKILEAEKEAENVEQAQRNANAMKKIKILEAENVEQAQRNANAMKKLNILNANTSRNLRRRKNRTRKHRK